MRIQGKFRKIILLACAALILTSFAVSYAHTSKALTTEYTYKVHNKSRNTILALMASEDGKTYGKFDIGDGIAPGQTVTLVWDQSTDNGHCEQWIKAVFDDGQQSPAAKFDFCEEDLVLEFS